MMIRAIGWALVASLAACGGEPPQVVTRPQPPPAVSVLVTPTGLQPGARWVFVTPESGVIDKLDLGDGSTLYVGEHGRREIVKGDTATDAQTLAPDTLIAIMKDRAGRFVFVTDNADVYVSREPLGELEPVRKGPIEAHHGVELRAFSKGHEAIMAVLSDGRLMRSGDYGASWTAVAYAGNLYGHPSDVTLDNKGNGVLLHVPQRMFVTHDDGATWASIASPATGARRLPADADDRIFVEGFEHKMAKLDGSTLVPTDDAPKKITTTLASPEARNGDFESVRILSGDHVVEIETTREGQKRSNVTVRSTKLGDKPGAGKTAPALATNRSLVGRIAGWGPHVVFLRADDADENAPTSTVISSNDYGATWKADVTLEGADVSNEDSMRLAAGPKGWAYVPSLCSLRSERHSGNCGRRQIRVAGGTHFEDLAFTEAFRPKDFTFDERHDKVYAVGEHDGAVAIYESKLTENKFKRVPLSLGERSWLEPALSVDDDGNLRVFTFDGSKQAYAMHRLDPDGKERPIAYLPQRSMSHGGQVTRMVFAGARGVLFSGDSFGWETADGGETWSRVAANGAFQAQCTEAGCATGETQRLGWDLPSLQAKAEDKIAANVDIPESTPTHGSGREDLPPPGPPVSLTCKTSGVGTALAYEPDFEMTNERADVRWMSQQEETDGRQTMLVGGRAGVRRLPLLPPAPVKSDLERRMGTRRLDGGYVAARYAYKPQGPVDVELAWFSLETGRVQRGALPKLDSFRVARSDLTGEVQIVSGGLLFQSTDPAPLFFIHDDGKVERMALPPHATIAHAQRHGSAWLLYDTDDLRTSELSWSTDNGKTWQRRSWALSDKRGSRPELLLGTPPWIGMANEPEGAALIAVTLPAPNDPPPPVKLDFATPPDATCDPRAAWSRAFEVRTKESAVHATIAASTLATRNLVTRLTPTGSLCTAAYTLANPERHGAILYRNGNDWAGWSFQPKQDKGVLAEALACTISK